MFLKGLLLLVLVNVALVCSLPKLYGIEQSYTLYTRQDWGALPATDARPIKTPVAYVIIHHTYIPAACNTTEECMAAMRSMQNAHIDRDFGDIGYNFCVGSEGGVYEGRGWDIIGVHAGAANSVSLGICLIGDWREDTPPPLMQETTKALIDTGIKKGIISPTYKLKGHNQIMATECPGTKLLNIISTWDHFSGDKFQAKL